MTLRKKTLGVICLTLVLMGTTVYAVSYRILISGFQDLESADIIRATAQTSRQMKEDLETLESTAGDWAPWDDTYRFISDLNRNYVEANLNATSLVNLGINFMLFLDTENRLRHCQAVDLEKGEIQACPEGFEALVSDLSGSLKDGSFEGNLSGYGTLNGKVVLLAASPILTSRLKGPSRGALVVGKVLDKDSVSGLEEKLKLSILMGLSDERDLKTLLPQNLQTDTYGNRFEIRRQDPHTISSIIEFRGLNNRPLFTLTIRKSRDILDQGRKSLESFFFGLTVISLTFTVVMMLFIEKTVLSRLSRLSREVRGIRKIETQDNRIEMSGPDEIGSLSGDINQMLDKIWEGRQWYQALFESASDAILIFERDRIVDCNHMAEILFLYEREDIIGRAPHVFFSEEDGAAAEDRFQNAVASVQPDHPKLIEWTYRKRDGTPFEAEVNLTIIQLNTGIYFQTIIRDVTERKKSQRLMIDSEKMLSLGRLAAGMAHEINNPLAGILLNAQLIEDRIYEPLSANLNAAAKAGTELTALQRYMENRGIVESLKHILASGQRAAGIVESMLSFARKEDTLKNCENLEDIIEKALVLCRGVVSSFGREIVLIRDVPEAQVFVYGSSSSLQHAFFNLFRNAAEALAGQKNHKNPEIRFRIFKNKTMAGVEITDNGPGMERSVGRHIFDPFFTTKEPGKGTGLGLSVAYFIICEHHGGNLTVETQEGAGTCFKIDLPLYTEKEKFQNKEKGPVSLSTYDSSN